MARPALIACILASMALSGGPALADDSEVEALRAQLRATVLQLRQLQDQQAAAPAAAPAAPTAPAADLAALKAKLAAAQSQARQAKRGAADAARLQSELTRAQADKNRMGADAATQAAELEKYRAAFTQADAGQREAAAERDRLKLQLIQAGASVTACQAKNVKLVKLSEDLLAAYRKVGFGQVLGAHEPFLGLKRVQLENLAQDREDAIRADRCASPPVGAAATSSQPGGS